MKKLLLPFLLFFSFATQAQNWCPPGATWYYRNFNTNIATYFDGTLELKYAGTTVTINNVVCKELKGTFYGRSQWQDPNTYTVTNFVTYRTYEANNVAYLFNVFTQHFDTIVNFNAHIGDSWSYVLYHSLCDDQHISRNKVTVYDTGHVVINGVSLKQIVITPPSATTQSVLVERIGGMPGFLFMKQDCDQDGSTLGDFSCYSDDNFPTYKKPGLSVCIFNTVGVEEQTLASGYIKLYPNPNTGNFKIDVTQACDLKIFNSLGALVHQSALDGSGAVNLDLPHLSAGIYFLKASNASGSANLKMVKE